MKQALKLEWKKKAKALRLWYQSHRNITKKKNYYHRPQHWSVSRVEADDYGSTHKNAAQFSLFLLSCFYFSCFVSFLLIKQDHLLVIKGHSNCITLRKLRRFKRKDQSWKSSFCWHHYFTNQTPKAVSRRNTPKTPIK